MPKDDLKTGYRIVGTRPDRPDGLDKVTGRARYGADISAPGMLHAAVVRSPHAHARIIRIDASKALVLDGVKAVITRADFPTGLTGEDWNLQENTSAGDPRRHCRPFRAGRHAPQRGEIHRLRPWRP